MDDQNSDKIVTIPLKAHNLSSYNIFAANPPSKIYHYSTLAGAFGIISSKSLWLTKIKYLNDTSELLFAIGLFKNCITQFIRTQNDAKKADFLNEASHQLDSFENTNICVASFCEDGNLLGQWRSYSDRGEGVAIGFSTQLIQQCYTKNSINLWKCIYDDKIHDVIMNDLIGALVKSYDLCYSDAGLDIWERTTKRSLIGYFNTLFLQIAPIIKNPYFCEEREWRLISLPIETTNENYNVERLQDNRLIQKYNLKFKLEQDNSSRIIQDVVIGPSKHQYLTGESLGVLLEKNNYRFEGISFSRIPYRTFS